MLGIRSQDRTTARCGRLERVGALWRPSWRLATREQIWAHHAHRLAAWLPLDTRSCVAAWRRPCCGRGTEVQRLRDPERRGSGHREPADLAASRKLGAQKLGRLLGVTQITLGSLIAAKPVAPQASAVGSFGAAGMMLGTLSFLATTPEAWQEGQGMPHLSMLGEALLKDTVLLGAALLTAAESLRAARAGKRS
jgi:Protein of unknown function, DUF417